VISILPYLQSICEEVGWLILFNYWRQHLEILEKQKFCQETLLQTEPTNPKENHLITKDQGKQEEQYHKIKL
jgi:hypothetical protein